MNLRTANNHHKRRGRRTERWVYWMGVPMRLTTIRQSPRPLRKVLIEGRFWYVRTGSTNTINCPSALGGEG